MTTTPYTASPDPVSNFGEGQWWIEELDTMIKTGTDDQKRAVAVVHHLLQAVRAAQAAQPERKLLSDEKIDAVTDAQWGYCVLNQRMAHRAYARAIEAAIKQGGEA